MAARRRNTKKAAPKRGGAKKAKAPKAKAIKEPKVIQPGPPVEVVLCILTGLMLLVAVILIDYANGHSYGMGTLFADSYNAAP